MRTLKLKLVLLSTLLFFIIYSIDGVAQSSNFSTSPSTLCTGYPITFSGISSCSSITSSLSVGGIGTGKASLVTSNVNNITMEEWVKWTPNAADGNQMLLYNGNSGGNGYGIFMQSSGQLQILLGGRAFLNSSASLTAGIWQHVALVRDANTWYIYLNGVRYATNATNNPNTPQSGTSVGCNNSGGENFDGFISNVSIWTSVRSTAQIQADMQSCSLSGSGLAAYWSLNSDGNDGSGNGKNLTLNNTSFSTTAPVIGASYLWNFGDGTTSTVGSDIHTYSSQGTYSVSLAVTYNSSYSITAKSITVNPTPTASISGPSAACGSATLVASGGSAYVWTSGSSLNTASTVVSSSLTDTVTVSNTYGCSSTASQTVVITPLSVAGTVSASQAIISGSTGTGTSIINVDQNLNGGNWTEVNAGFFPDPSDPSWYIPGTDEAQSFTASVSANWQGISINVDGVNQSGDLTLNIYSGDGINGSTLLSQTVNISNTGILYIPFSTPVSITSGQVYTFQFTSNGSADVYIDMTGDNIPSGNYYQNGSNYGGALYFQNYYQIPNANWNNLTLAGNTGNVLYWQESSDNNFTSPVTIANTGTTLYSGIIGNLSATTYFRAVVQNGSCAILNTNIVTILVGSSNYIWTGATSTDWSDATNWTNNILPPTGATITIPSDPANQPVLTTDISVENSIINGSVGINGHTLTVTGLVGGQGTINGSTTAGLVINSSSNNTINFGTSGTDNQLANLTVSGTGATTLGSSLNITGILSVTAGTLNTGDNLTLKSTSIASTAQVGIVSGTITGKVTVERFIPQGNRTYRDLAATVANTTSIFDNWQEGGNSPSGYGIYITGKAGSSPGIDASGLDRSATGSPSLYKYAAGTWPSITNTINNNFDPFIGYRALIRGDRSYNLFASNPSTMVNPTTLRTTGNLITGDVLFSTNNVTSGVYTSTAAKLVFGTNSYSFIANPYACLVDWEAIYNNAGTQNVSSSYWYFDPTFLSGGYATYVTYNAVNHLNNNPSASKLSRYIQPGMAFFVQNTGSTPVLTITESNKAPNGTKTAVFKTTAPNYLHVSLWKNINGENTNIDGAVAVFSSDFTKVIGDKDSKKIPNGGENLFIKQSNTDLSIAGLPVPTVNEDIALNLNQLVAGTNYQLQLDASQFTTAGLEAFIKDKLLNTIVPATEGISFTATKDAATYEGRFSVVFKAAKVNPIIVKGAISIYPNPVSNNKFNLQMSNLVKGTYTVSVINNLGQVVLNSTISNESGESLKTIASKGLTTGVYTVQVIGKSGSYNSELIVK